MSSSSYSHKPDIMHRFFAMPVLLIASIFIAATTVIGVMTYGLSAIITHAEIGWGEFFILPLTAALSFMPLFAFGWRYHKQLSPRMHILLIEIAGAVIWYWIFAPCYQYLTVSMSSDQIRVDVFAYLWEVVLLATPAFIQTQYRINSVVAYVTTGKTDNPRGLYESLDRTPLRTVGRNAAIACLGFVFGGLQVHYFAKLPLIETYKHAGIGLVLPFFLSAYYYVAYDAYLGPIKSRLAKQYNLNKLIRNHYSQKVIGIFGTLTIGILALTILLYIQSAQHYIDHTLKDSAMQQLATLTTPDVALSETALAQTTSSEHGSAFTMPVGASLDSLSLAPQTKQYLKTHTSGQIIDRKDKEKVIAFRTIGDTTIYAISYPSDYYSTLTDSIKLLGAGGIFVIIVAGIMIYTFSQYINRTLLRLIRAVAHAQESGNYPDIDIHTGDEFETLNNTFAHFVRETHLGAHKLAEEHARLQASIASLRQGFIMTDNQGIIVAHNTAAASILGTKNLNDRQPFSTLIESLPNQLNLTSQWERSIAKSKPIEINRLHYGERFLDVFITPIISGTHTLGCVILFQDVTEAQLLNRSKDEFFSIASHELRTPLTVIRGNTSIMLQMFDRALSAEPDLKDMVLDMHHASIGLIDIVNDFLDASRLEQGKMTFADERINMPEIIQTVTHELDTIATQKNIYLRSHLTDGDTIPVVRGDSKKVRQILYNLVGNAIKFTDAGGIDIHIAYNAHFVTVTVSDTGRGIPIANQKLLFRKFQQASNNILTRDATHGTGLGLYISRLMIHAMGGKITLEKSVEGQGSTFSFSLPIDTSSLHTK